MWEGTERSRKRLAPCSGVFRGAGVRRPPPPPSERKFFPLWVVAEPPVKTLLGGGLVTVPLEPDNFLPQ
jgi:hypothetical protein